MCLSLDGGLEGFIHPGDLIGIQQGYEQRASGLTIRAVTACEVLVLKVRLRECLTARIEIGAFIRMVNQPFSLVLMFSPQRLFHPAEQAAMEARAAEANQGTSLSPLP
jgi:hypothetical protein